MTLFKLAVYFTTFIWVAVTSVALTQWLRVPKSVAEGLPVGFHTGPHVDTGLTGIQRSQLQAAQVVVNGPPFPAQVGDEWFIGGERWVADYITCTAPQGYACTVLTTASPSKVDRSANVISIQFEDRISTAEIVLVKAPRSTQQLLWDFSGGGPNRWTPFRTRQGQTDLYGDNSKWYDENGNEPEDEP